MIVVFFFYVFIVWPNNFCVATLCILSVSSCYWHCNDDYYGFDGPPIFLFLFSTFYSTFLFFSFIFHCGYVTDLLSYVFLLLRQSSAIDNFYLIYIYFLQSFKNCFVCQRMDRKSQKEFRERWKALTWPFNIYYLYLILRLAVIWCMKKRNKNCHLVKDHAPSSNSNKISKRCIGSV